MYEQRTEVSITLLAHSAQPASRSRRVLARREAETTRQLSAAAEAVNVRNRREQCSCGKRAYAWDAEQGTENGILTRDQFKFSVDGVDAVLDVAHFFPQCHDHAAHAQGQTFLLFSNQHVQSVHEPLRAAACHDSELTQQCAHRVDARRARLQPLGANTMEGAQRLLIRTLDCYRVNARATLRLEDRFAIRTVGFVAAAVRLNVMRRQQGDVEAARRELACPEMRTRTRFHHHAAIGARAPEVFKLSARESPVFSNSPRLSGNRNFKNVLVQIDRNCYR